MIRRAILAVVLLAIWLAVLGWTAGLPWHAPLLPQSRIALQGSDFRVQIGAGAQQPDGLSVSALAEDGNALQSAALQRIHASDYPILNYRIADFPDTLELVLVFRRADTPDDTQTISIAAPGSGTTSIDLSTLPDWRGDITEIAFAEYATGQLVPPSLATFRPFRIVDASLQSHSWSEVVPRLRSDWFGYRPWALYSISALGPQIATLQTSWMQPALVAGSVLSLLAAWLILTWSRRRIAEVGLFAAFAAWLLMDLRWLDDLVAKHRVIEQMFAGKTWTERAQLQPDEDTLAAANEVARIAAKDGIQRVLVASESSYTYLRIVYFLLPLNATPLNQTLASLPGKQPTGDVLIAVYLSDATYDEASHVLHDGAVSIHAEPVFAHGDLRLFRSQGASR